MTKQWTEANLDMIDEQQYDSELSKSHEADYDGQVDRVRYLYDWEVTVDSTLTFKDGRKHRIISSCAYIDDYDLVNKGADDLVKRVNDLKVSSEDLQFKKLISTLRQLGYACRPYKFCYRGYNPWGNVADVKFEEYKHSFRRLPVHHYIATPSSASPPARSPVPRDDGASFNDSKSDAPSVGRSSSSSPTGSGTEIRNSFDDAPKSFYINDKATITDKSFDLNYDEMRDGQLVARDANVIMKNDRAVMKYWFQRFRLFSKLDEGILMDRESWFSVTPERLATHIADRMIRRADVVVLDAFSGAGGNAIQFAKFGAHVYAIDLDPIKLRCAARNAKIYGVEDRISFICADFFHVAAALRRHKADTGGAMSKKSFQKICVGPSSSIDVSDWAPIDMVFLSPPWGGPAYLDSHEFDLDRHMEPKSGTEIYKEAKEISPNICYYLPRNTSVNQLVELNECIEMEQAILNGKFKTLNLYFGNLICTQK